MGDRRDPAIGRAVRPSRLKLFVVTGASRGLGAAIAERLLGEAQNTVLCISRHENEALAAPARQSGATLEQWRADLAEPAAVAARLRAWLAGRDAAAFAEATLINNAGVLTRIGALEACSDDELSAALRVGLEAPLLLMAAFLRATAAWSGERRVLNISSGLGRRAMAGQATYCAAKAGMDHLSRAVALDQALLGKGAKIVALAPGVIDTDMQVQLRSADGTGFPDQAAFVRLKEAGQLTSSRDAAARVLAFLARADFGATPVADVRDA
ncbi:MAG: SDR family NAD(P)-dependent oxidoreductase [Caldimonas sp.]